MEQRVSLVTLGVADLGRAKRFYEALGWRDTSPPGADVVFFQVGGLVFGLWDRDALAEDCGVANAGPGFGGIALAHNVRTEAEVDAIVAAAQAAGGHVKRQPGPTFWGGYSGVFTDLDGYPWEIAVNSSWQIGEDGSVTLPAYRV